MYDGWLGGQCLMMSRDQATPNQPLFIGCMQCSGAIGRCKIQRSMTQQATENPWMTQEGGHDLML